MSRALFTTTARSRTRRHSLSVCSDRAEPFGFALLETLIAGCILAIAVVSLYCAYSYGFGLVKVCQETVRADQILVQKIETLRVYGWSQICSNGFIPATFTNSLAPGSAAEGTVYEGTISISNAPLMESYAGTLRQVTVSLTWDSGSITRSRSLTSLVSQYGIQTFKK